MLSTIVQYTYLIECDDQNSKFQNPIVIIDNNMTDNNGVRSEELQ